MPRAPEALLYQQTVPFQMRKGDLRKLEIVRATLTCLSTQGIESTNYETVGKLCSLKRPHVAYHFPERTEMIAAAIRYAYAALQQRVIEAVEKEKSVSSRLGAYVKALFEGMKANPEHKCAVALLVYLSTYSQMYRVLSEELRGMAVERLRVIITPAFPKASVSRLRGLAEGLHTAMSGELLAWATRGTKADHVPAVRGTIARFEELLAAEKVKT